LLRAILFPQLLEHLGEDAMPNQCDTSTLARILICENETLLAKDLERSLKSLGYEIIGRVSSGEEAVRLVEESKPALILMDIELPGSVDGIEAANSIRSRFDIPLLYLTAYAETDDLARAKKTEPYGYLTKQAGHHELRSTIETALYKHEADKKVREREKRYHTLIDSMAEGAILQDCQYIIYSYNSAAERILGVSLDLVVGKSSFDIAWSTIKEDGSPYPVEEHPSTITLQTGKPFSGCIMGIVLDEGVRWISINTRPLFTGHEKLPYMVVISFADITDLKNAEKALRESCRRLEQSQHIARIGTWEWHVKTGETYWSDEVYRIFGLEPGSAIPSYELAQRLTHPDDKDMWREYVSRALKEECSFELEYRAVRVDGTVIWIRNEGEINRNLNGEPIRILGTAQDISMRKKTEEALVRSKEELRLSLDATTDGIWKWNFQTNELEFSPNYYTMLGYQPDEFPPTYENWVELIHPDDRSRALEVATTYLKTKPDFYENEFRVRTRTGEYRWIHTRARVVERDPNGEAVRMIGSHADITENKKAEEELRESEEKYRTLFEESFDGLFITSPDGKILDMNKKGVKMFGYDTKEEILCLDLERDVYAHPPDRKRILSMVNSQGSAEYEVVVKKKSGEEMITYCSLTVVRNDIGNTTSYRGIIRDITQRKKDEEALRTSEAQLSNAMEMARLGHWELDVLNKEFTFNDQFYKLFRTTAEQVGGYKMSLEDYARRFLHPDDISVVSDETRKAIETDDPFFSRELEHRIVYDDGDIGYITVRFFVVKDDQGRTVKTYGVNQDITERKKAEEALRVKEEEYRRVIENSYDVIYQADMEGRLIFASPSAVEFYGYTLEEMHGMPASDLYAEPEHRNRFLSLLMENGIITDFEAEVVKKDGSRFWVSTNAALLKDVNGKLLGFVGVSRDITEQKSAREALKASEEKYRTVVEESFDGIFVQKGTVITFANSRLHEMLGYQPGELEGLDHRLIYHPDFRELTGSRAQARLRGESPVPRYEVDLLRKDGTSFPGEVNAKVIYFENEPGIQVWVRDLTEQKLLEKRLIEAQKMEAVGTLAGGIAHDFNNILQVVSGHAELLESELAQRGMTFSAMDAIRHASQRGADLVKQILTFSRRVESKFEVIDLNDDIKYVERLLYRTIPKMIDIELKLADEPTQIQADSTQIEQVLINLAVNAKDAMTKGGKLTITTQNVMVEDRYCTVCGESFDGRYVLLTVSDTGHGMSEDVLQHIFEPFFTTKGLGEGTGLGLSTVMGIVRLHGGHTICDSEVGKGTNFSIYFPVAEPAKPQLEQKQQDTEMEEGIETILVVDDEQLIAGLAKKILERVGYSVITANSGKEALDIYFQRDKEIDLVILDLIMPEMGGEECLRELLKINPQVKTLIATGFAIKGETKNYLDKEAKGRVAKPFNMRELLRSVRHVLDGV
jgi:two-component system cell cycle sensor histidine kinase/response regulator CckA